MRKKRSSSILKKFLLFNFFVFLVLGLFTVLYLKAIQPNLIKKRSSNHFIIIQNTNDHLQRLNINLNNKDMTKFLLSTRFLFQNLNRVQFFDLKGDLIGDTNILDLDQSVFVKEDQILEESIDGKKFKSQKKTDNYNFKHSNLSDKEIIRNYDGKPFVFDNVEKNNFYINTLSDLTIDDKRVGFIKITEEANDILVAVKERKNFILRTVLAVCLVILIFSLFLNKYILKPIKFLVYFTESIKNKSKLSVDIDKLFIRQDEVGKLTKSIDEMTKELQKRTTRAETFSTDLAHEIRNPLASLKGASELLDKSKNQNDRDKFLKIIDHDVSRIERLITDYSQMLKDEASLSREKMNKIDLLQVINSVVEDFKLDLENQNKQINILVTKNKSNGSRYNILGIESRLAQVIANLLDNAISFSSDNQKIEIVLEETASNYLIIIKDEGPGFTENSPQKIFKRFYSNRPKNFGEHSGLGLNIVKNIVELHKGTIAASNRVNFRGAQIEVLLPKIQ